MRIFTIVLNPEKEIDEKFEILGSDFIPEPNTVVIIKNGNQLMKASVVKVESVLDKVGDSADVVFNIFVKILPPEENVN